MFSSLLPLRSNESVTGGFELKPLVQSHCDVLRSMRLGAVLNCSAANQENAPVTLWRWQFTPKPQIALASHVLVEIRICSYRIILKGCRHTGRCVKVLSGLSEKCTARFLDNNSCRSSSFSLQWDMNGSVNMFCSLLPLRSNESVTGGFELKPLVQSHCDVLRSMRLGAVWNCSAAYQENALGTLWRWQFTPKPQIALASHVLVEIR